MNKQELIDYCNALKEKKSQIINCIDVNEIIKKIKQLDEPEKVTIPQVIAEYIKQKKDDDYHLLGAMIEIRSHKNKEIDEWFEEDDNMELFARAWLDGYEVEKEKRYRISMPKARNHKNHAQILCEMDGSIFWCGEWYPFRTKFTRKELEKLNFGWVFDCEGIEIEEA